MVYLLRIVKAVVCLAVFFSCAALPARQADAKDTSVPSAKSVSLSKALDTAIDSAITQKRLVGAVVLVSHDGRLVYHRAAGYADRETQSPMQKDTIFRLASVSKVYTAMATAALLRQGVLRLDDPVAKWLPDFTPPLPDGGKSDITVRQLLSHTAGLDYGFSEKADGPYHKAGISDGLDDSGLSLSENLRRIASVPLLYKPGTSWRYSVATDVLGGVIEKAAGTSLPEAVQTLLINPLGITDSGFVALDKTRLAVPYYNSVSSPPVRMRNNEDVDFGGGMLIRFAPDRAFNPASFPSGGAGMVGTAPDLMRLLEAIRKGGAPLTSLEIMEEMGRTQTADNVVQPGWGFALGWSVLVNPAEASTPQSPGTLSWGGVYGHSWFIDLTRKLSVVILTNTAPEGMWGQVTTDVRDAVYAYLP